jgi:hypothetical protein
MSTKITLQQFFPLLHSSFGEKMENLSLRVIPAKAFFPHHHLRFILPIHISPFDE